MTAVIGMAAFAIDLGVAYAQRARLQKVADSAALAGMISWVKSSSGTAAQATANDVVLANGWPASIIKATAAPTASNPVVTVSLAAPSSLTLGLLLIPKGSLTTTGLAIAGLGGATPTAACLVALSTLMVDGAISAGNCAVVANSNSSSAITVNGGGSLSGTSIDTPGGIVANGTVSGTKHAGSAAASDPYAGMQTAEANGFAACKSYQNLPNGTATISAGCYTGAIGGSISLNPGTYYFSNFNMNSGSSLTSVANGGTANGATILLQSNFSPNGNISIVAPTTGVYAGLAIYAAGGMNMNSNIAYNVIGGIYSPTQPINMNSGTFNSNACTYIVAYTITSNSGANLTLPQANCSPVYSPSQVSLGSKIALLQ